MATERQKLIEDLIQEKRISIDLLEKSNREYREIIDFIKAPSLLRLFIGIGAWVLKLLIFASALLTIVLAFFLIFSLYWPDEIWVELYEEVKNVQYTSMEMVKIEAAQSLMFWGIMVLIIGIFLIILGFAVGAIRKRSRTINHLSVAMSNMLSHQEKYLRHEQNAYLTLTQELKAPH